MNLPHSKDWNRDFRWFSIFHSYVRPEGTIFPIPPCSPIGRGVFTATELGLCLCGEGTIDVSEWKATGPPLLATWWTRRAPDGTGCSSRKKKKSQVKRYKNATKERSCNCLHFPTYCFVLRAACMLELSMVWLCLHWTVCHDIRSNDARIWCIVCHVHYIGILCYCIKSYALQ